MSMFSNFSSTIAYCTVSYNFKQYAKLRIIFIAKNKQLIRHSLSISKFGWPLLILIIVNRVISLSSTHSGRHMSCFISLASAMTNFTAHKSSEH